MTNDKEVLLMQYRELCSLHQFYLKMVFSSALFVNAIMSGVAVYVLEHIQPATGSYLKLALLFPMAISFSYSIVLFRAKPKCKEFKSALDAIVDKIDVEVGPHVSLTIDSISIFGILYLASGVTLGLLFISLYQFP